jgi:hypothetical protein
MGVASAPHRDTKKVSGLLRGGVPAEKLTEECGHRVKECSALCGTAGFIIALPGSTY